MTVQAYISGLEKMNVAAEKDYIKVWVNFWRLKEESWQKIVVLRENIDNVNSIPESTGRREI